jgi:hypothetical protein
LLGNIFVNNSHWWAVIASFTLATVTEQRNGVFWQSMLRGYNWEGLLISVQFIKG